MLVAIVSENKNLNMPSKFDVYEVAKKSAIYRGSYDLMQYQNVAYRKKDYSLIVNYLLNHGVEVVFYISDLPDFVKKAFEKAGISYINRNFEEVLQEKFVKRDFMPNIIISSRKDKDLEEILGSEIIEGLKMSVSYKEFNKQVKIINESIEKFAIEQGFEDGQAVFIQNTAIYPNPFIQMGVNDYSTGAMNPKQALIYAKVLRRAEKEAENFKYNGYKIQFWEGKK